MRTCGGSDSTAHGSKCPRDSGPRLRAHRLSATSPIKMGAMRLLRERGFLLLSAGQFLNTTATWSLRTVLLIWVYSLTHSGVAVSLVGLAEALPLLVLGPIMGVYVDRWNRAYTMAGASLATAVLVLPLLTVGSRS